MENISVDEVKRRMDSGEQLHLIDVREPDEYAAFNIGAKLVPLGQILSMQTDELESLKNEEVILHCRSGKRSMQAGMMLESLGFTRVKNMTGGMLEWEQKFGSS